MSKNKMTMIGIGVLVVLAVVLISVFGVGKAKLAVAEKVATVNGVAITKTDYDKQFASLTTSLQAQGTDVTASTTQEAMKKQVLDNLINNELVTQGIKSTGITTTPAEVDTQLQTIITQNGGQDGFKTALAKANITEAELRVNISNQLSIQKYLAANVKVESITVTDPEISTFYAQYKQANGTSTPALKTISAQIKQQITLNKQQTLIGDFVAALRAKATITTSI